MAFELSKMVKNLTDDIVIFTNGPSELSEEQISILTERNIQVNEKKVIEISHENGNLNGLIFNDGSEFAITAIYARPDFAQHCDVPQQLGCELDEHGLLTTDLFSKNYNRRYIRLR